MKLCKSCYTDWKCASGITERTVGSVEDEDELLVFVCEELDWEIQYDNHQSDTLRDATQQQQRLAFHWLHKHYRCSTEYITNSSSSKKEHLHQQDTTATIYDDIMNQWVHNINIPWNIFMHKIWRCGVVIIMLVSINIVTLSWVLLLLGWVTVCGQVNHLSIQPTTQVNSAFHPSGAR